MIGTTKIELADGSEHQIKDIVDEWLSRGPIEECDDGVSAPAQVPIWTLDGGRMHVGEAVRVWKRSSPRTLIKICTKGGRSITVTPTHPLFVHRGERIVPEPVSSIDIGVPIATISRHKGRSASDKGQAYIELDWDPIASKEEVSAEEEWVYDLEVKDSHNFISNGIISHNSQMLRYMSHLAPRGIYASGKSSSAAGLCVGPEVHISANGEWRPIGEFVEKLMSSPLEIRPGVWKEKVNEQYIIDAISGMDRIHGRLRDIWRIKTPPFLIEIECASGNRLTLTPETRVWGKNGASKEDWIKASDITDGQQVIILDKTTERISWTDVRSVRARELSLPPFVYDLTVEGCSSFIGNGFLIHNTAAAVKDDFGEGRWTLEAGALVLADKGLAAIDELDKMTDQDRSSMHEAMESQSISVAKAGITATLQCRCSLLGAANPKYGRFEEHQYIADQINMPPALLSRFDLIFAMTDKPNAEKDARITAHILMAHRRGQVMKHEDLSKLIGVDSLKILEETDLIKPVYERDFLRKYVAYSKRIYPVLSDEAMKLISDFYLKIRKQGEGEGASVPITARQLEAFVRLSEASARARLSNIATADDATRAIRIVEYYLRKIAGEGDKLDFDIIATGTSHSQREQIGIMKDLIAKMAKDAQNPKNGVKAEDLFEAAKEKGIPEDRTKTLIKRLSENGEIYSPTPGCYRMASEG